MIGFGNKDGDGLDWASERQVLYAINRCCVILAFHLFYFHIRFPLAFETIYQKILKYMISVFISDLVPQLHPFGEIMLQQKTKGEEASLF